MKIRGGFVSNSSSSSFIAIGVKVKKLTDEQENDIENAELEAIWLEGDNYYVVGTEFACWDDCDGVEITSIKELEEIIEETKTKLKKLNEGWSKIGEMLDKVAIHYGSRMS